MRVEFLQGIRKEELPQENRVGRKNSRPQLMAQTGTKEEGSITAKIFNIGTLERHRLSQTVSKDGMSFSSP